MKCICYATLRDHAPFDEATRLNKKQSRLSWSLHPPHLTLRRAWSTIMANRVPPTPRYTATERKISTTACSQRWWVRVGPARGLTIELKESRTGGNADHPGL